MSFKSPFGALEDVGGSCLGFDILISIWIWLLVFDTPMFQIFTPYLDCEGKEVHPCHLSPDLGLWRRLDVPDRGMASSY